ncbi:unnamed protein product, partial [Mesorhabditis belari]|uniref:Secreted protein n=1 Tax=Mesorhabditis belari TaxID=2138241 RepID=A0AAF3JBQ0_9BILA
MKQIFFILLCSTYVFGVHSTQQASDHPNETSAGHHQILDVLQSYWLIIENGVTNVYTTQLYSTARVDIPTTRGCIPQHRSQKCKFKKM